MVASYVETKIKRCPASQGARRRRRAPVSTAYGGLLRRFGGGGVARTELSDERRSARDPGVGGGWMEILRMSGCVEGKIVAEHRTMSLIAMRKEGWVWG